MNYYLLFLDESGTNNLKNIDPHFPILVLVGILLTNTEYAILQSKIKKFKERYSRDGNLILHRRDMRRYENGFEFFMNENIKRKFYKDLNKILIETDYKIIATAIDKKAYLQNRELKNIDPYQTALSFLLEKAVSITSQDISKIKVHIESRGKKEDKIILKKFTNLIEKGSSKINSTHFKKYFETELIFRHKEDNEAGIEIADLCAHPIARYILNNNEENLAFDIIKDKISSNSSDNFIGYGIQIYPTKTIKTAYSR